MNKHRFGIAAGLVALASVAPQLASAQAILTFQRSFSSSATTYDAANDVAVDSQGNVVTVGHTTDAYGNRDVFISKQDRVGNLLWTRAYKGNGNGNDSGIAVTVGQRNIPGLKLLLGNLTGATLLDPANKSVFWTPGSPFITLDTGRDGVLSPGERVKTVLRFSGGSPAYAAKPLAGQGQP